MTCDAAKVRSSQVRLFGKVPKVLSYSQEGIDGCKQKNEKKLEEGIKRREEKGLKSKRFAEIEQGGEN